MKLTTMMVKMIKKIKNPWLNESEIIDGLMSDVQWLNLKFQRRIEKIQSEIGISVKNCNCKKCFASRLAINEIIMIAFSFNVEELEYESEKRAHKKKKPTGKRN